MKYSESFERDYNFYFNNINNFTFCGTLNNKYKAIKDIKGKLAKEVFWKIDSNGKNIPTSEPELLDKLLLCKASVNFQIKQWAEGVNDLILFVDEFVGEGTILEWKVENGKPIPIYHKNMKEQFGLPDWVIKAVFAQAEKLRLNN